jgi:nucleoside-triphosphatase
MTIVNALLKAGVLVSGFYCPEVRSGGRRIGFKIVNIATGETGWLAKVSRERCNIRVGRYCVDVEDALRIGLKALSSSSDARILAIDELGPMELKIGRLREAIIEALKKSRAYVVVAHARLSDREVLSVLRDSEWYNVTEANRDRLRSELPRKVISSLGVG